MSERTWRDRTWWWPLAALPVFAAGVMSVIMYMSPSFNYAAQQALCDEAVKALLHSNDLVEVTRAGIIIRRLDCSIGRRLGS